MASNFHYKLLYKTYSTEKDALAAKKKLPECVTNPFIEISANGVWCLYLYQCNTKNRATEAQKYYKDKGSLLSFIQE